MSEGGRRARALLPCLLGSLGPGICALLLWVLAPDLGGGDLALAERVFRGGLAGLVSGWATALSLGIWIHGLGGRVMLPVTVGFLLKLALLATGTLLFYGPFKAWGRYEAFAVCFACGAFTFQTVFQLLLGRRFS